MVHVVGTVHDVADNPDRVERIVVRAAEPRMHDTTYITEESAQFPVVDGVLDFNVLPGLCVVAFLRNHGATTYAKLLVPDAAEATFKECLEAGNLAEEGDRSALEKVVRQIQDELAKAAPLVEEVRTLSTEVRNDKTAVDGFTKAAKASASKAATSEANAKTSETKAASSASASASSASSSKTQADKSAASATQAASSRDAAKTSETIAASHKQASATSESNAAIHETNAEESAIAAANSATEAKGHADRAEVASDPEGLRNEVTQRFAELVDGAPEDLDTIREIAEYAKDNRSVTDQLNAAIGNKADKSHEHQAHQVKGLLTTGEMSIVPRDQDTGRQTWANFPEIDVGDSADAPPSGEKYYVANTMTATSHGTLFPINPELEYYISFWAKADKPGSKIYLESKSSSLEHAVEKGGVPADTSVYLVNNLTLPTEWTFYESYIKFQPSVSRVLLGRLYWNHSRGQVRDATQMISDITIIPIPKHIHSQSDITDATDKLGRVSDYGTANKLVRTNDEGQLTVYTSSVTKDSSVANKNYVDIEVTKKADSSHKHVSSDITDAVAHIHGGRAGRLVQVGEHGHIRDGNRPTDQYDLTNKMYVDEEVGKKANASHTHTTADITDSTDWINHSSHPNKMVRTREDGYVHGNSPTADRHVATKGYVDGEVGKKANASHTHTTADITDFATEMGKKADKTHTHTTSQVTGLDAALDGKADKSYVDSRPAIFTVPDINSASTDNLVPGDVVVDTSTWIFYYLE